MQVCLCVVKTDWKLILIFHLKWCFYPSGCLIGNDYTRHLKHRKNWSVKCCTKINLWILKSPIFHVPVYNVHIQFVFSLLYLILNVLKVKITYYSEGIIFFDTELILLIVDVMLIGVLMWMIRNQKHILCWYWSLTRIETIISTHVSMASGSRCFWCVSKFVFTHKTKIIPSGCAGAFIIFGWFSVWTVRSEKITLSPRTVWFSFYSFCPNDFTTC